MADNTDKKDLGYLIGKVETIVDSVKDIKKTQIGVDGKLDRLWKQSNAQDHRLTKVENNQWWFFRIFGTIWSTTCAAVAWLWHRSF